MRLQLAGESASSARSSEYSPGLHISAQSRWGQGQGGCQERKLSSQLLPAPCCAVLRIGSNVLEGTVRTAWGPKA